jgi:protein-disulfide isomerase-like protein with CxxC motif
LTRDLALRDELGVTGFPSLVARSPHHVEVVMSGWAPVDEVAAKLKRLGHT